MGEGIKEKDETDWVKRQRKAQLPDGEVFVSTVMHKGRAVITSNRHVYIVTPEDGLKKIELELAIE